MEMMLEIYFERLGSSSLIKGMLIKKMCVCIYMQYFVPTLLLLNTGKGIFNVFKSKRNMAKP